MIPIAHHTPTEAVTLADLVAARSAADALRAKLRAAEGAAAAAASQLAAAVAAIRQRDEALAEAKSEIDFLTQMVANSDERVALRVLSDLSLAPSIAAYEAARREKAVRRRREVLGGGSAADGDDKYSTPDIEEGGHVAGIPSSSSSLFVGASDMEAMQTGDPRQWHGLALDRAAGHNESLAAALGRFDAANAALARRMCAEVSAVAFGHSSHLFSSSVAAPPSPSSTAYATPTVVPLQVPIRSSSGGASSSAPSSPRRVASPSITAAASAAQALTLANGAGGGGSFGSVVDVAVVEPLTLSFAGEEPPAAGSLLRPLPQRERARSCSFDRASVGSAGAASSALSAGVSSQHHARSVGGQQQQQRQRQKYYLRQKFKMTADKAAAQVRFPTLSAPNPTAEAHLTTFVSSKPTSPRGNKKRSAVDLFTHLYGSGSGGGGKSTSANSGGEGGEAEGRAPPPPSVEDLFTEAAAAAEDVRRLVAASDAALRARDFELRRALAAKHKYRSLLSRLSGGFAAAVASVGAKQREWRREALRLMGRGLAEGERRGYARARAEFLSGGAAGGSVGGDVGGGGGFGGLLGMGNGASDVAANESDSFAAFVAELRADFEAELVALRAKGLLQPSSSPRNGNEKASYSGLLHIGHDNGSGSGDADSRRPYGAAALEGRLAEADPSDHTMGRLAAFASEAMGRRDRLQHSEASHRHQGNAVAETKDDEGGVQYPIELDPEGASREPAARRTFGELLGLSPSSNDDAADVGSNADAAAEQLAAAFVFGGGGDTDGEGMYGPLREALAAKHCLYRAYALRHAVAAREGAVDHLARRCAVLERHLQASAVASHRGDVAAANALATIAASAGAVMIAAGGSGSGISGPPVRVGVEESSEVGFVATDAVSLAAPKRGSLSPHVPDGGNPIAVATAADEAIPTATVLLAAATQLAYGQEEVADRGRQQQRGTTYRSSPTHPPRAHNFPLPMPQFGSVLGGPHHHHAPPVDDGSGVGYASGGGGRGPSWLLTTPPPERSSDGLLDGGGDSAAYNNTNPNTKEADGTAAVIAGSESEAEGAARGGKEDAATTANLFAALMSTLYSGGGGDDDCKEASSSSVGLFHPPPPLASSAARRLPSALRSNASTSEASACGVGDGGSEGLYTLASAYGGGIGGGSSASKHVSFDLDDDDEGDNSGGGGSGGRCEDAAFVGADADGRRLFAPPNDDHFLASSSSPQRSLPPRHALPDTCVEPWRRASSTQRAASLPAGAGPSALSRGESADVEVSLHRPLASQHLAHAQAHVLDNTVLGMGAVANGQVAVPSVSKKEGGESTIIAPQHPPHSFASSASAAEAEAARRLGELANYADMVRTVERARAGYALPSSPSGGSGMFAGAYRRVLDEGLAAHAMGASSVAEGLLPGDGGGGIRAAAAHHSNFYNSDSNRGMASARSPLDAFIVREVEERDEAASAAHSRNHATALGVLGGGGGGAFVVAPEYPFGASYRSARDYRCEAERFDEDGGGLDPSIAPSATSGGAAVRAVAERQRSLVRPATPTQQRRRTVSNGSSASYAAAKGARQKVPAASDPSQYFITAQPHRRNYHSAAAAGGIPSGQLSSTDGLHVHGMAAAATRRRAGTPPPSMAAAAVATGASSLASSGVFGPTGGSALNAASSPSATASGSAASASAVASREPSLGPSTPSHSYASTAAAAAGRHPSAHQLLKSSAAAPHHRAPNTCGNRPSSAAYHPQQQQQVKRRDELMRDVHAYLSRAGPR